MKNLIVQYGQCDNNCSYCYLKKLNIKSNISKFKKTIGKIGYVDNLMISYKSPKWNAVYDRIISTIEYNNLSFTVKHNTYSDLVSSGFLYNKKFKEAHVSVQKIEELILAFSKHLKYSYYLNNNNFKALEKILKFMTENYNPLSLYVTIEKSEPINFTRLFQLYTDYPDLIDLDSCYKRAIVKGFCQDVIVLNEDGNLYGCPYTTEFKLDNVEDDKPKTCPFIKKGRI